MNPIPNRVVIYAKDVANITGLRPRSSRKLLAAIRKANNKPLGSFITVQEFAAYTGIGEDLLRAFLV
jgi:hypothetical protein